MKAARPSCSTCEWCASNNSNNNKKKNRERERDNRLSVICVIVSFFFLLLLLLLFLFVWVSCIQKERRGGKKKNGAITSGKREMKSKVGEKTSALSSFFFSFRLLLLLFCRLFFCVLTSTSARSVFSHTSHAYTRFKSLTTSTSTFLSVFLFLLL